MSKGSLRCCGLPLYLKSKYGSGYSLVLTRKSFENNLDNDFDDSKDKITDLVRSIIPNSRLDSNINSEMTFVLSSNDSDKFAALFDRLEKLKDHLNLINVGISATTIEQVFLK
jgi:ATP-binding cassette subfamily A (ABC1) protein 3